MCLVQRPVKQKFPKKGQPGLKHLNLVNEMYNQCWLRQSGVPYQNYNCFYISLIFLSLVVSDIHCVSSPVRIKKALAQHVCKQASEYISSGTIQPPQTKQPDGANGVECGWYTFQDCSGEKCNLQPFRACGNGTAESGGDDDLEKNSLEFVTGRIVGGIEAKPHSYPSIVAMYWNGGRHCGGTILNAEWVLSASHCINRGKFEFVAGLHDLKNKKGTQTVTATKIIKHEKYVPRVYKNDIALFKVSPPFQFNDNVKALTLPKSRMDTGKVTAVGWGKLKEGGSYPNVLQQVDLPILAYSECEKKERGNIHPGMLCTLHPGGGKDACQGDSGGPLFAKDGPEQVGVVSWGVGCARKDRPGVYVDIAYYLDWIQEKIKS